MSGISGMSGVSGVSGSSGMSGVDGIPPFDGNSVERLPTDISGNVGILGIRAVALPAALRAVPVPVRLVTALAPFANMHNPIDNADISNNLDVLDIIPLSVFLIFYIMP